MLLSSFLRRWVRFFWFWQKNGQVCRKSNLSVQRKNVKKILNNWFFVIFGFLQEKLVFSTEIFRQDCQNYVLRVHRNTYRATFLKWNLEKLRTFGWFLKFSGQRRETFLRLGKTVIDVPGNSLWKNFFQRENFVFFSGSGRFSNF